MQLRDPDKRTKIKQLAAKEKNSNNDVRYMNDRFWRETTRSMNYDPKHRMFCTPGWSRLHLRIKSIYPVTYTDPLFFLSKDYVVKHMVNKTLQTSNLQLLESCGTSITILRQILSNKYNKRPAMNTCSKEFQRMGKQ